MKSDRHTGVVGDEGKGRPVPLADVESLAKRGHWMPRSDGVLGCEHKCEHRGVKKGVCSQVVFAPLPEKVFAPVRKVFAELLPMKMARCERLGKSVRMVFARAGYWLRTLFPPLLRGGKCSHTLFAACFR